MQDSQGMMTTNNCTSKCYYCRCVLLSLRVQMGCHCKKKQLKTEVGLICSLRARRQLLKCSCLEFYPVLVVNDYAG